MKSGTTSLFHYLDKHPDVYMPSTKELRFFVEERNWKKGRDWYEAQFAEAHGQKAIGEASPAYTNYPAWRGAPERILGLIPDVRLIYLLRHPIERMESHYRHETIVGREKRPIDEAITTDSSYFFRSCYGLQLDQYLPLFDRKQILVVTSEELRNARAEAMTKVCSFLELDLLPESDGDQEFHRSEEKGRRSALYKVARKVPGYSKLSGVLTEERKASLRSLAYSRRMKVPDSKLSDERRTALTDAVRADVGRLREIAPDLDGWGIA